MKYLSPSILASDFSKLGEEISIIENEGLKYLHIDVMDGIYVPNISFGIPIIKSIRGKVDLIFDTHLMIEEPSRYIEDFYKAGSDIIYVHPEATKHLHRTIQLIKSFGMKAGIALNPSTSLDTIDYIFEDLDYVLVMSVNPGFGGQKYIEGTNRKLRELSEMRDSRNKDLLINVDGGIKVDNADKVIANGADIIVSGSGVFNINPEITKENIRKFKDLGFN